MTRHPLDGELFYLGRDVPGVIDLLMLRSGSVKAVLLFHARTRAEAHLAALDPPQNGLLRLHAVAANDFRAKEELCLAGLAQGAGELWLDAPPGSLEPQAKEPLPRALAYIRSFKNETTCL